MAHKGKNKKKLKQKPSSSEEMVRAIFHESSPGGISETTGCRICKTGRF